VAGDEGEIEMRFVAPWNLTGNPALSIPCGFAEGGLPAGLQLTGRLGDDARLLRIGEALHQALALPLTPPGIDRQSG
jgi:Asp-tRNA(Asn)/Glu-tRNA(Gln) amidotransferase A subunit family amidase